MTLALAAVLVLQLAVLAVLAHATSQPRGTHRRRADLTLPVRRFAAAVVAAQYFRFGLTVPIGASS